MARRDKRHRRSFSTNRGSMRRRLAFEPLEHRRLLAITVDTILDVVDLNDGVTSLREAIFAANTLSGADMIEFAAELTASGPATILLTQGELVISEALTIDGPGMELLTIDAQEHSRIYNITAEVGDFALRDMTLVNGRTTGDNPMGGNQWCGGAIRSVSVGRLTLERLRVADSGTTGEFATGGGVFTRGETFLSDCFITGNFVEGLAANAGGISSGGDAIAERTVFSNNRAMRGVGGAMQGVENATIVRSLITQNAGHHSRQIGGVIAIDNITLIESVVSDNIGNGLVTINGDVSVTGSTVSGNSTLGIDSQRHAVIRESTISANGGGVLARGHLSVIHSTVYDNHATASGMRAGGVYVPAGAGPVSPLISHSIVAGNSSLFAPDVDPIGDVEIDFSLIGDNTESNLVRASLTSSAL